jgi:hypothetical protein
MTTIRASVVLINVKPEMLGQGLMANPCQENQIMKSVLHLLDLQVVLGIVPTRPCLFCQLV